MKNTQMKQEQETLLYYLLVVIKKRLLKGSLLYKIFVSLINPEDFEMPLIPIC